MSIWLNRDWIRNDSDWRCQTEIINGKRKPSERISQGQIFNDELSLWIHVNVLKMNKDNYLDRSLSMFVKVNVYKTEMFVILFIIINLLIRNIYSTYKVLYTHCIKWVQVRFYEVCVCFLL